MSYKQLVTSLKSGEARFSNASFSIASGIVDVSGSIDFKDWKRISTQSINNTSSVVFNQGIDSTYKLYRFVITSLYSSANDVSLLIQMSTNSGTSYQTSYYTSFGDRSSVTAAVALQTSITIPLRVSNSIQRTSNLTIDLFNPSDTGNYKQVFVEGAGVNAAASIYRLDCGAYCSGTTSAINAVKFTLSSGNLAGGNIDLYGLVMA
ncbi:MAG: hypothetical protein K0S07_126 [Chlamydiales bacterium]|jgi:hypothetical protein|nr:hypothetical protein [Chlamydiales bacterium]